MKKMFVVSIVLVAALAMGCSKKNAQTTPTPPGDKTDMKKDGDAMGGGTYGAPATPDAPADPCAAPK